MYVLLHTYMCNVQLFRRLICQLIISSPKMLCRFLQDTGEGAIVNETILCVQIQTKHEQQKNETFQV